MASSSTRTIDCHKKILSHGFTVKTSTRYKNNNKKVKDCTPGSDENFIQRIVVKNRRTKPNVSYINILVSANQSLSTSTNKFKNLEIKPNGSIVDAELEIDGEGNLPYQGFLEIDVFNSSDKIQSDSENTISRKSNLHWQLQPGLKIKKSSKIS